MKRFAVLMLVAVAVVWPRHAMARIWTDSTGKHKTEAELVAFKKGWVQLKKPDGKLISLPLDRLSPADREYVEEQYSATTTGRPKATTKAASGSGVKVRGKVTWDKFSMFVDGKQQPPDMMVNLLLSGKLAAEAIAYGHLDITAVTDAAGKTLTIKKKEFEIDDPTKDYVKIDRDDTMFASHPKKGVCVPLRFAPDATATKKLSLVEGTLKLRTGGTPRVVTIDRVASRDGKSLDDPALKEAGLTVRVKIMAPSSRGPAMGDLHQVVLIIEGNHRDIVKADLVDAAGKSLKQGGSTSQAGDTASLGIMLSQPVPADAKLQITLRLNSRELDVPFRLTNLKIPPVPKNSWGGF